MHARANARRIAAAAMFVALSLIAGVLPTLPGTIFKFGGFPLLLAGLLVGPRTGFAIGCMTDLMGFALRPSGMFFPGFTLTQGLTSMIPGLMSRGVDPLTWQPLGEREPAEEPKYSTVVSYVRLFVVFGVTQCLTSVVMVAIFTSKFVAGTPLFLELSTRAFTQSIHVPIYTFLAIAILKALSETELYRRLLKARR